MAIVTSGIIGTDLAAKVAGTGSSSDEGNDSALGTCITATDGQQYEYVHASAAITQYDFVGIDENWEAAGLTAAMVDDGWSVGVAQVAFADNDLGWVSIKGHNLQGRVAVSCAEDVALRTTGSAGVIDDNTTGSLLDGIVVVATNTVTATAAVEVLLTWPRSDGF